MAAKKSKNLVIVRTYSAGVHVGYLESHDQKVVVLSDACRIWRWRGANTLHELALRGPNRSQFSRISERVPSITLTEAIEIILVAAPRDAFDPVWL